MVWKAPADEGEYYALSSPTDNLSTFSQLFVPFLGPGADPTFGREALPRSPDEERIRAEYKHRDAIVSMNDGAGNEWVAYQVWEGKEGVEDKGDLLIVHGLNDYGGKYSNHGRKFLDEGYRLIVPDLPAHGRSTGVHVYLPNLEHQADAMYLVMADVLKHDSESGIVLEQKRKIFIAGQSLGGFVAAYTCLKYGSPRDTDLPVAEGGFRPEITGGLFLCPMLAISPETRPYYMVELLARGIASFAGPLPLASANKGNNSDDPDVEIQFQADPQTYHGKLRAGTGLAILKGLTDLNALMSHLKVPFSIYHGTGDRVTSYHGSEKLYQEASSTDKKLNLYEGYQHILLRVGHDELDDLPRQNVLNDMLAWLREH